MMAQREKDQKRHDVKTMITEADLRTNTGIQQKNIQKSSVTNYFVFKHIFPTFFN